MKGWLTGKPKTQ